ncbi:MAG: RNA polymerase sigma factor [Leifsonia sp.]
MKTTPLEARRFGELFDEHRDRVFRHASRHAASRQDAEDITALVFLEAWRRRAAIRLVDGSPLPWLLVTTNHVASNHDRALRRHRRAMARLSALEEEADFAPQVDEQLDAWPRHASIRTAFERLSSRDRDVVSLCVIEELPLAAAAEALGVPLGTVKSRLSRAKARLAALMNDTPTEELTAGGAR